MKKIKKLCSAFLLYALAQGDLHAVEGSNVYLTPVWEYGVSHWGNGARQKGSLWGAALGYAYSEKDSIYFNLEFTAAAGRWTGSVGNNPTQEYITESRFGYVAVPCPDRLTLTPFVGVGSYVFNQSPNFTSYFWYIPIGVILEYQINKSWTIGLMGLGAPTFSGSYKISHRGSAPTSALWKAELPITYVSSLPFNCSVIPFVKEWAYHNHGELIKQRNMYYGLKLAFGYQF
ncbi:MAG: hypothetical protein V4489_08515 [Chlamydiota bacterium]